MPHDIQITFDCADPGALADFWAVALGATRIQRFEPDAMDPGFIVMRDPEGNEFCLD